MEESEPAKSLDVRSRNREEPVSEEIALIGVKRLERVRQQSRASSRNDEEVNI